MIYRGRFEDIIFEFSISHKPRCAVVLCDGLPSVPKQKEVMTYLSDNGCHVFYPRYCGTWESGGKFLDHSPSDDITRFVRFLKKGSVTELYGDKLFVIKEPIVLVGSSFGGTVALSLADNVDIGAYIIFSPIVDLCSHNNDKQEQDLIYLGEFIKKAFGNGYRFSDDDWAKMAQGHLFNPPQRIDPVRTQRIIIAYSVSDRDVNHMKISRYASLNNIKTITAEHIGHLSLSKIPQNIWETALDFIDSKVDSAYNSHKTTRNTAL